MVEKSPLYIVGMHGMGDNIHQRAIIKHLLEKHDIWLETTWPQIYHDLPIKFVNKGTTLRTQQKNAANNMASFTFDVPMPCDGMRIFYTPQQVRDHGSVMRAMIAFTGLEIPAPDYRLPIPTSWLAKADALLESLNPRKPLMIYRPLIERTEWSGCASRNPDYEAYGRLADSVRDEFYVISIADVVPGVEWIVGPDAKADAEFHRGELDFETIAGLVYRAAMVYGSPGFIIVMGRSLQVPTVCVFGGYENSRSFTTGAGAYLGVDPIEPCQCFSHHHPCKKAIHIPLYEHKIKEFARAALTARKD